MSDRIAIFNRGRIEQLGRGEDLYDRPVSLFVADFIGESNILHGQFERDGEGGWLTQGASRWRVGAAAMARAALDSDRPAALVVRPERFRIIGADDAPVATGANEVEATVRDVLYLGSNRKYELTLPGAQAAAVRQPLGGGDRVWLPGDRVRLAWAVDDGVLVSDPHG